LVISFSAASAAFIPPTPGAAGCGNKKNFKEKGTRRNKTPRLSLESVYSVQKSERKTMKFPDKPPSPPLPLVTADDVEAFIDMEMTPETEQQVWVIISNDPILYSRYKKLEAQKKLLQDWWDSETPESRYDLLTE
jgi:hypothetical protein